MRAIWYLLTVALRGSLASPFSNGTASVSTRELLLGNSNDDFDPEDLSFIKKFAAVGDSYSAGIGAGGRLGGVGDWFCSRYDHSYPNIINNDPRLGDSSGRQFQFHSCSGAVIDNVINDQLPHVDSGQDVLLLSAGGNDAELVNILNQCVYQWAVFNSVQVPVGKMAKLMAEPWAQHIDFDTFGRGCQGQLQLSQLIIQSQDFSNRLDAVIAASKKKINSGGMIYYTGYAKFWDTNYSPACDKISWAMWIYRLYNMFHDKVYLTSQNRKTMNNLVDLMNEKIEAAVERAGPQVEFVNYDELVGMYNGRYCAPGVDESQEEANTREGLMFYELESRWWLDFDPWKRSDQSNGNGTFQGDENLFARITSFLDPDATLAEEHRIEDIPGSAAETEEKDAPESLLQIPNILPDGIGRVFHPQTLLHEVIANLIIWRMSVHQITSIGDPSIPDIWTEPPESCPVRQNIPVELHYTSTPPGQEIKDGIELRVLPVGDSITVGYLSDKNGGNGDGYRRELKDDISKNDFVYAGTETSGTMNDGYYAAWSGKTIQYIADHVGPSLEQRPNIVLLAAGTNDMNPDPSISTEGNDPAGAADRLGKLIDKIVAACPDATVLVSVIINTCNSDQEPRTLQYQSLIPGVVKARKDAGKHVLAVDFTTFPTSMLQDCIHPTLAGYKLMGDYWYDYITQIPPSWITKPVGKDPVRDGGLDLNGGIDRHIPPPDWGTSPIQKTSSAQVYDTLTWAEGKGPATCDANPLWRGTGEIALGGVGHNGDWKYHKYWVDGGKVADGLGLENEYVRLHDMNGDGKADYVWIDPNTGEIRCWINNLPDVWTPAGNNNSIIGSGVGPAKTVYIADMNGDGMEDYLVVDPDDGSVRVWWNYGPDENWVNGWKFVGGGEIATGVPHANLATLRFPDINGDGRADYVYIGEGGSLRHWMNVGSVGLEDPVFFDQGGIATGAVDDISKLVFADVNGDGRDDYLIWDDDGGLTGYLNQRTNREGVPLFIGQGPAKTIADGISQSPSSIRLADMDGDGKDDYVFIGDHGSLHVWYNRGTCDDSMTIDGLRFAKVGNSSLGKDYVWLDPKTGAPRIFWNSYYDGTADPLGWSWQDVLGGKYGASGAAPASQVQFGDINGDGLDDYLVLDPKTGALRAFLLDENFEAGPPEYGGYLFHDIGTIASGVGPGKNVRIADIDGDGRDDYIYINKTGGAIVYRNAYGPETGANDRYERLEGADAFGIHQRPEEITFADINGDGKADYIWTRAMDGRMEAWLNMWPETPAWHGIGEIAAGVGTSGANIRYAKITDFSDRADYIAVDPNTGALASWLNGCNDIAPPHPKPPTYRVDIAYTESLDSSNKTVGFSVFEHKAFDNKRIDFCFSTPVITTPSKYDITNSVENRLPIFVDSFKAFRGQCFYVGTHSEPGHLICDGLSRRIQCRIGDPWGTYCNPEKLKYRLAIVCEAW